MHEVPMLVKYAAFIVMVLGLLGAIYAYLIRPDVPAKVVEQLGPIHTFVYRKWMFDELYHYVFVVPAFWLGRLFWKQGDEGIINRFGPDGAAWAVMQGSVIAKRFQSGYLTSYALIMLIGLVAAITWVLF
jgi:NADH-quinone oxidoreductase subunit L